MDLRIVNTCNNNCIYCLEQGLRRKRKFIKKEEIFEKLQEEKNREILCFYGGNPLLHPDLEEIIIFARNLGFKNISLLTNTSGISEEYLQNLKEAGLTGISFYFQSFDKEKQKLVTGNGIELGELIKNILFIKKMDIHLKCIIHLNKQNIEEVHKNIIILQKKFGIHDFEFIKYRLVSRAKNFSKELEFNAFQNNLFSNILKVFDYKSKI